MGSDRVQLVHTSSDRMLARCDRGALHLQQWSLIGLIATVIFSTAVSQAAALLAIFAWIWRIVRRRATAPPRIIVIPFVLFHLGRVVSVIFSVHPHDSALILRTELPFALLLFSIVDFLSTDTQQRLRVGARLLVWTAVLAVAAGVVRMLLGGPERLTSTTSGYYTLGMYLCVALAVLLAINPSQHWRRFPWVGWIVGAVLLAGLVLTQNRLHWVLAGLILFVFTLRRPVVLGAVAAMMLFAWFLFPSVFSRVIERSMSGDATSGRAVLWSTAWDMREMHPVTGFGPRTFRSIFPAFDRLADKEVGSWHNDYVQVYMDSGLLTLVPFLSLIGVALWQSLRILRRLRVDDPLMPYARATLLVLASYALAGGMLDVLLSLVFFSTLGILCTLHRALRW